MFESKKHCVRMSAIASFLGSNLIFLYKFIIIFAVLFAVSSICISVHLSCLWTICHLTFSISKVGSNRMFQTGSPESPLTIHPNFTIQSGSAMAYILVSSLLVIVLMFIFIIVSFVLLLDINLTSLTLPLSPTLLWPISWPVPYFLYLSFCPCL